MLNYQIHEMFNDNEEKIQLDKQTQTDTNSEGSNLWVTRRWNQVKELTEFMKGFNEIST